MVIRLFLSAVSASEVDEVLALLREDVVPVFTAHPDCLGIEIVIADSAGAGGMVEGGVLTRWTSADAMEAALASPELLEGQARVRQLMRREPKRLVLQVVP
jgi:quinol monooxygenase YgiN